MARGSISKTSTALGDGEERLYFRKVLYTSGLLFVIWGYTHTPILKAAVYNSELLAVRFHMYYLKKVRHLHSFRYQKKTSTTINPNKTLPNQETNQTKTPLFIFMSTH